MLPVGKEADSDSNIHIWNKGNRPDMVICIIQANSDILGNILILQHQDKSVFDFVKFTLLSFE